MIQYNTNSTLLKLKIKFISYVKKKTLNNFYFKFHTKRIIVNKAPKHFNIGQHSIKIRLYRGLYSMNCYCVTNNPIHNLSALAHSFTKIQLQIHEIPQKIVFCYKTKFKFNFNVIFNKKFINVIYDYNV